MFDFSKVSPPQPRKKSKNPLKPEFIARGAENYHAKKAKEKIPTFSEYFKATLQEGYEIPPHIKLICDYLDRLDNDEFDRLAIHLPPRHGKSTTVTILYSAYRAEYFGEQNIIITGYSDRFVRRLNRRVRNIVADRTGLSADNTAADEWTTKKGGTVIARGVGGVPTGIGATRIILDDVIKSRQDAESPTMQENQWDWYSNDLYSRLEPGGKIIIVATRWHYNDITFKAQLSEPDKWVVLNLPAICEEPEKDQLNRGIGEALWPSRFNVEDLNRIKNTIGPYAWESLYQQNPAPKEGSFFMPSKINVIENIPELKSFVRAWDLASSKDGDYTVGIKVGVDADENLYILDVQRGQFETNERDLLIKQTVQIDGIECKQYFPMDPGAAGKAQQTYLLRMLNGYSIFFSSVSGSKQTRAEPLASRINGGLVFMVRAPWNRDLLEELRQFPMGKNDDQCDALADAYLGSFNKKQRLFAV